MASSILSTPTYQALAANIKNADGTTPLYLSGAWTFQNASAQTTLSIDSSGNVGVGTITPVKAIEIYKTNTSTSVISGIAITNTSQTANTRAGITFRNYDNWGASIWSLRTGSSNGSLVFGTNTGAGIAETNIVERMKIHTDGYLYVTNMPTVSGGASALTGAYNVSEVTITDGYYGTALHWQSLIPGGYRQHASLGSWRSGAWGSVFLGVGGSDNSLTAFWTFAYNGASYNPLNSSSWSTTSDIRIKQNIRPLNSAIEKITSLNPVHFEYVDKPEKTKTGFIAQEFEKILPGHVHETGCPESISDILPLLKNEQIKSIDADLIPYLVGAIKEQQAQIEQLKSEVEFLRDKVSP